MKIVNVSNGVIKFGCLKFGIRLFFSFCFASFILWNLRKKCVGKAEPKLCKINLVRTKFDIKWEREREKFRNLFSFSSSMRFWCIPNVDCYWFCFFIFYGSETVNNRGYVAIICAICESIDTWKWNREKIKWTNQ